MRGNKAYERDKLNLSIGANLQKSDHNWRLFLKYRNKVIQNLKVEGWCY